MKVLGVLDLNGNQIINVDVTIDGVENDIVKIDSNGNIVDSGVSISDLTPIPNIIESISVNSSPITPVNKNVNIDLSGYAETANLATVATSGDYTDLQNTPDLSGFVSSSDLATVATTGDYEDLDNKPELAAVATSGDYDDLQNTPEFATVATSGDYDDLDNKPDLSGFVESSNLAAVATSGDYDDLQNKPDVSSFISEADIYDMGVVFSSQLAEVATSGDYEDLQNTPDLSGYAQTNDLATVATSGDYTDLDNTPTIPTRVDELEDASDYALLNDLSSVATSGDYEDLENKPDLSDFLTSEDLENVAHYYDISIEDSNVSGEDAYEFSAYYVYADYPVIQVVHDGKVVYDGIEISFDNSNPTPIKISWDSTKYTVDSNNPLHVTVIG